MTALRLPEAAGPELEVRSRYVLPGQVCVAAEPTRFLTILGSCVAVCLYDSSLGVGGLNHFLLPGTPQRSDEKDPLRWGLPAIEELVAGVLRLGARPSLLQAKVFGGAQISAREIPAAMRIGERNIETALAELRRRHIPVMNQSLGGHAGCKLIFESQSGMAWVKRLVREDRSAAAPPSRPDG